MFIALLLRRYVVEHLLCYVNHFADFEFTFEHDIDMIAVSPFPANILATIVIFLDQAQVEHIELLSRQIAQERYLPEEVFQFVSLAPINVV